MQTPRSQIVPEGRQHVARGGPPRVTRVLAKTRVKSRSPNGREMRVDGNRRHAEAARAGAHFGLGMLQLNGESIPRPTTRTIRSPGEENYLRGVRANAVKDFETRSCRMDWPIRDRGRPF